MVIEFCVNTKYWKDKQHNIVIIFIDVRYDVSEYK